MVGEDGYGGMIRPIILGFDLNDQLIFFFLVYAVFVVVAFVAWRIVRSPFGTVLEAIRENSQRAAYIGYDVRRYRLIVFIVSAFIVGIAGSLFPFLKYYIGAELVHVQHSGEILAMSILGGSRHFLGPPLGGLFFILMRELLSEYTASWQLIFGILFMGLILFSPTGLMGLGSVIVAPLFRKTRKAAMASRVVPLMQRPVAEYLRNTEHPPFEGNIFECRDVGMMFGNFSAVAHVDLEVKDRSLQSLIGPNGAGKTTLFNLMSGEYEGDGELRFLGKPLNDISPHGLSHAGIARSFQITNLFPDLTVYENLRLGVQSRHRSAFNMWRGARSIAAINTETDSLVEFLGLKGLEDIEASSLSYGGQRLLEIGLALTTRKALAALADVEVEPGRNSAVRRRRVSVRINDGRCRSVGNRKIVGLEALECLIVGVEVELVDQQHVGPNPLNRLRDHVRLSAARRRQLSGEITCVGPIQRRVERRKPNLGRRSAGKRCNSVPFSASMATANRGLSQGHRSSTSATSPTPTV